MAERPNPVFRSIEPVFLIGAMAVYDSQDEASQRIPQQWRQFRSVWKLGDGSALYGASPCTGDHKIHYLAGVVQGSAEGIMTGEYLTLEAGEYAVVRVEDATSLRDTWIWLLES